MPTTINVNTASLEELERELNLSAVVAGRIIRTRAGAPFEDAEDLTEVDGIGPATVERIKEMSNVVFAASSGEDGGATAEASSGVRAGVTVNEKGDIEITGTFDIGKLLESLSKSSKDRDFKKIARAIKKLGRLTIAIVEKLIESLPEGEDKRKIRRKARQLKDKLEELQDAIEAGDEEAAEEAADEVEDILDDLEDLLDDAGIDLPTGD